MTPAEWEVTLAAAARRALDRIPAKVAIAVFDFMDGPLRSNPHRVGKSLRGELSGRFSARVGAYRVVYRLDEPARHILVVLIDHRADVYRPR